MKEELQPDEKPAEVPPTAAGFAWSPREPLAKLRPKCPPVVLFGQRGGGQPVSPCRSLPHDPCGAHVMQVVEATVALTFCDIERVLGLERCFEPI